MDKNTVIAVCALMLFYLLTFLTLACIKFPQCVPNERAKYSTYGGFGNFPVTRQNANSSKDSTNNKPKNY